MNVQEFTYVAPVQRVADLGRSISYYMDRLGFNLEFNYEGSYACVVREGCRLHLKRSTPQQRDQREFEATDDIDVCFAIHDASALSFQFERAGAAFSAALRKAPYGYEFYIKDPDGYILAFVQTAELPT